MLTIACEVCCEGYRDAPACRLPRCLPRCGHDLCSGCLAALCARAEHKNPPRCPICRTPLFSDAQLAALLPALAPVLTDKAAATAWTPSAFSALWQEWPVLRCALRAADRIDFQQAAAQTPLALVSKVVRHAPSELLSLELERRRLRAAEAHGGGVDGGAVDGAADAADGYSYKPQERRAPLARLWLQAALAAAQRLVRLAGKTTVEQRIQFAVIVLSAVPLLLGSALIFHYPGLVQRWRA